MINYTTASSDNDLMQILDLQQHNLAANLSPEQLGSQGFVTVQHDLATLQKMNSIEQHIIAKDGNKVIAYLLAMTSASQNDIPLLVPMFRAFDETEYFGKRICDYQYIVVGQVCVADGYRGQGILDKCYNAYKEHFRTRYDFAITEIAASNKRSLNAHKRIGFNLIKQYEAPNGENWDIVIWDWEEEDALN